MPQRHLPSESKGPAGRGIAGFEVSPSDEHLLDSAKALTRVAEVVRDNSGDGISRPIRIGHLINNGFLSLLVYGLPILEFENNSLVDLARSEVPLTYAVVVNQPIDVQVETTVSFLADFVSRQQYIAGVLKNSDSAAMRRIDLTVRDISRLSQETVIDDLALGWEMSAARVARRASEIGWRLDVSYVDSLVSSYSAIAHRTPLLKRIYNTSEEVRNAVDGTVALIGTRDMKVVGGGSESLRSYLQQQLAVSSARRYINHAFRDALVTGNGYLAFRKDEPFSLYNLAPESVEVPSEGRYVIHELDGSRHPATDEVLHIRGLRQPVLPYGLGVLEAFVGDYFQRQPFQDLNAAIPMDTSWRLIPENKRQLDEIGEQHGRILRAQNERFRQVLTFVPASIEPQNKDLYFPGFELYE